MKTEDTHKLTEFALTVAGAHGEELSRSISPSSVNSETGCTSTWRTRSGALLKSMRGVACRAEAAGPVSAHAGYVAITGAGEGRLDRDVTLTRERGRRTGFCLGGRVAASGNALRHRQTGCSHSGRRRLRKIDLGRNSSRANRPA